MMEREGRKEGLQGRRAGRVFLIIVSLFIYGCGNPVTYVLSERYDLIHPYTIAIMPVEWDNMEQRDEEVARLFRIMTFDRLQSLNYKPIPLETVDRRYGELSVVGGVEPSLMAKGLGVDGVLYIRIIRWKKRLFVPYASLKVGAEFVLYGMDGTELWRARYSTKESDIRLDRSTMELAIIKAYEPRIQRIVDRVFTTLPAMQREHRKKTYFEWLP